MKKFVDRHGRRLTQVVTAVLYNCNITGFAKGEIYQGKLKNACVPGLNCYSCPGAVGACPMGSLQSALVTSRYRFPYYILGMLLLMGVLLGRFVCGFMCPVGLVQELLYKIPGKKLKKSKVTRVLSCGKYVVLVALAVMFPIFLRKPGFCKYVCPAGTFEGGVLLGITNTSVRAMLGRIFTWKMVALVIIVVSAVSIYRSFCRFICPLGAFYSLFNRFSFVRMVVDESKCNHCGACQKFCRMDIKTVGDRECIQCRECKKVCSQNAIS
ncbi:MAG: 4Fe-4S binding protein [Lachnospiraceae bacterium]|nr:4Fe-4S binding protein [Lachnospiraceae bacterium]